MFPSSYPARYFRNEGFSLTGKEIELPWQLRAQHPFIYIGFDVRLAKSFIRSGKFFFQSKLCPRSIWYGVWFSDQKLRRAKKRKVKVSQFAIAINTLTRPRPPITHFLLPGSISLSSPEFLVFISGFLCFFLSFIQKPNLRFDLLTRFGFHLHLLVDICHPFSVFLSVSETLFRPLQYLRVVVFLPSDLFFALSTKQISFL